MADDEKKLEHINVKVVGQDQTEVYFKIKRSTPLKKLMDAYGEKMGKKGLKFLFDGRRISPDMTAEDLGIENEDIIEANLEQIGGCSARFLVVEKFRL